MRRTLQLIGCALAVWLAAPPAVTADPITITSGVITLSSHASPAVASTTLTGSDGTRMFTFAGVIQAAENEFGPYDCWPCVSQLSIQIFSGLLGTVTYGNESYHTTYAGPDERDGGLNLFVPDVRIPLPVPLAIGETQTFSAPFTASGSLYPPYDPFDPNPGLRNTLTGSGIATVTLVGTPTPIPGGGYWEFVRAEYQLSAPAPIPEPASFLLFASGLSALVLKRRSRAV
jgi:PEP-CTERM motif-containing protein